MKPYQREFIELALAKQALSFGEFTLKSGRQSPYFFNMGVLSSGKALQTVGRCYAHAMIESGLSFSMLFGPAYKGITLSASCAMAFYELEQRDIPYAFNRKEAKDHGEGGKLVGHRLMNDVFIIDDVITAGTAIHESMQLINQQQVRCAGVIVALDRQECGQDQQTSAIETIQSQYQVPVIHIIALSDLITYLKDNTALNAYLPAVVDYKKRYGIR